MQYVVYLNHPGTRSANGNPHILQSTKLARVCQQCDGHSARRVVEKVTEEDAMRADVDKNCRRTEIVVCKPLLCHNVHTEELKISSS